MIRSQHYSIKYNALIVLNFSKIASVLLVRKTHKEPDCDLTGYLTLTWIPDFFETRSKSGFWQPRGHIE